MCQLCNTDCLLFYLITLQTWKTSRRTEEALFLSVKVREWFCCAAPHHILEVKHCYETMMYMWLRWFRPALSLVPISK